MSVSKPKSEAQKAIIYMTLATELEKILDRKNLSSWEKVTLTRQLIRDYRDGNYHES
jgi:hypothetical protein